MSIPAWPHQRPPRYLAEPEARRFFAVISDLRDRALLVSCSKGGGSAPSENLLVTDLHVRPDVSASGCDHDRNFAAPITLTAGQPYVFRDPGCIWPECLGNPITHYDIALSGRRPEPDGGTFNFSCDQWNPSYPSSCHWGVHSDGRGGGKRW